MKSRVESDVATQDGVDMKNVFWPSGFDNSQLATGSEKNQRNNKSNPHNIAMAAGHTSMSNPLSC